MISNITFEWSTGFLWSTRPDKQRQLRTVQNRLLLHLADLSSPIWSSFHKIPLFFKGRQSNKKTQVTSILGLCTVESSLRRVESAADLFKSSSTSFRFFTSILKEITVVEDKRFVIRTEGALFRCSLESVLTEISIPIQPNPSTTSGLKGF